MYQTIKAVEKNKQFWERLVYTLHLLDIKILEHLYCPQPTTTYFKILLNRLARWNVKRTAIRNRIRKLEKLGLVHTIPSGILLVNSIPEIAQNVQKLILRCKLRWEE